MTDKSTTDAPKPRGGYRKNARRPLKYGEPTVHTTITLPASLSAAVTATHGSVQRWIDYMILTPKSKTIKRRLP